MDSTFGDVPAPKPAEVAEPVEVKPHLPFWLTGIDINLLADHSVYPTAQQGAIPPEIQRSLNVDWKLQAYAPIIYLSDFWCLRKYMTPLNDTLGGTSVNLTLNFRNYNTMYF